MPRSKRAKWKILTIDLSANSRCRLGAGLLPAGICTTSAEPSPGAMRIEPHRLGVDRHRALIGREVGKIAAVQADGHDFPLSERPADRKSFVAEPAPLVVRF